MRWVKLSRGKYTLVLANNEVDEGVMSVPIQLIKSEIQSEWDDATRAIRAGRNTNHEYVPVVYRDPKRIGPRESGEAADRQYHGSGINGEW